MAHEYQVQLNWQEGRKGLLSSEVLNDKITVATPPEFPKGIEGVWSPEHFFVAAVNSCLMTTFLAVAENSKLSFSHFECNAVGTLDKVEGKFMITAIKLQPKLVIPNESEKAKALRVLEMSEKACLISNSIKSEVTLEAEVIVEVPELV